MKKILLVFLLLCSTTIHVYGGEYDSQFRVRINPVLYFVKPEDAKRYGISKVGISILRLALGGRFYKYFFTDIGFGIAYFSDNRTFEESVVGGYGGNIPHDAKSSIHAGDLFYHFGAQLPLYSMFKSEFSFGQTFYSMSRSINNCKDCSKENIPVTGGKYIQATLLYDFGSSKNKSSKGRYLFFSYYYFFEGSTFNQAFSIGYMVQSK